VYGTNREKVARIVRSTAPRRIAILKIPRASSDGFRGYWQSFRFARRAGDVAARHGLHVLTEKPLDISTAQADALITAAEEAGVKLGVFFQDRFKTDLIRVKEWADAGVLGKLILADARVNRFRRRIATGIRAGEERCRWMVAAR
jgi:predicted dehydrogenase